MGSVGKLDAGLSVPELRNLGLSYPLKKPNGSGYFLRSRTKLPGFNPLPDYGLGLGDSGGSDGPLRVSDQYSSSGALRVVDALDLVIL